MTCLKQNLVKQRGKPALLGSLAAQGLEELAVAVAHDGDVGLDGQMGEAECLEGGGIVGSLEEQATGFAGSLRGIGDFLEAGGIVARGALGIGLDVELQVHGSDEKHIDAFDGGNGSGVLHAFDRFDLGEEHRGWRVFFESVVEGAHHPCEAAISAWRKVHGADAGLGFLDGGNHRDHDARRAPVECSRDAVRMRRSHPHDWGRTTDGLELWEHGVFGAAAVLKVDEQPIKATRIREFGDDGGAGL